MTYAINTDSQNKFWIYIDNLHQGVRKSEQNAVLSADQYGVLFEAIDDSFGERATSSFVKICAQLKDGKLKTVIKALLDLKDKNWMLDDVFALEKRVREKNHSVWGPERTSRLAQKYPKSNLRNINPERAEFLARYFIFLSADQKIELRPSLKPERAKTLTR